MQLPNPLVSSKGRGSEFSGLVLLKHDNIFLGCPFFLSLNLAFSSSICFSFKSKLSKADCKLIKNVFVFKYCVLFSLSSKYAYNIFAKTSINFFSTVNNNTSLRVSNIFITLSISSISSP